MDQGAVIMNFLGHQKALARFGIVALKAADRQHVIDQAAAMCATSMATQYCKICRFRIETGDFLIEAGVRRDLDVVGAGLQTAFHDLST